jgi:hypothetical protein
MSYLKSITVKYKDKIAFSEKRTRFFSSNTKIFNKIDPNWITGFCDAEGCFSVIITRRSNLNWRSIVSFEINLHIKDIEILYQIKEFFGVGLVTTRPKKFKCLYRVTKIEDLINVIIPHFSVYSLISQKYSDFVLWSKVVKLMHTKQHLKSAGFQTILTYYASINRGLSTSVLNIFPNIVGVNKINVKLPDNLNPNWVSGFTAGDGGFFIGIRKNTNQVYFRFHITQHSRDSLLMKKLIIFFGCGNVNIRSNTDRCDFYVQDFTKIYDIIIPHFNTYSLYNIKSLDFSDFKKAAELFKLDSCKNVKAIKNIKDNMNSKREQE